MPRQRKAKKSGASKARRAAEAARRETPVGPRPVRRDQSGHTTVADRRSLRVELESFRKAVVRLEARRLAKPSETPPAESSTPRAARRR